MRRLVEHQPVVLDLAEEAIDCVVEAVMGDEVTLEPVSAADAGYIPSLGRAATLVFESEGRRARVDGGVRRSAREGRLQFVAGGGAHLPPRRQTPRADARLEVELTPLTAGGEPAAPPHRLRTTDVSLGGLAVEVDAWSPSVGDVLQFTLALPATPAISGTARVLRVAGSVAGLELAHVAPAERARLAAFLIATRVAR